jgi:hypothetical protein
MFGFITTTHVPLTPIIEHMGSLSDEPSTPSILGRIPPSLLSFFISFAIPFSVELGVGKSIDGIDVPPDGDSRSMKIERSWEKIIAKFSER